MRGKQVFGERVSVNANVPMSRCSQNMCDSVYDAKDECDPQVPRFSRLPFPRTQALNEIRPQ